MFRFPFFDILADDNAYNTVIGTRSDSVYRGKGYAKEAAKRGMDWYEKNKDHLEFDNIIWGVRSDNIGSIKIAKDLGFKGAPGRKRKGSDGKTWSMYYK